MNCDQAFDAMTDTARLHDRDLGDHLRGCPRCRQMYETLEPALGLFASVDGDVGEASPSRLAASPASLAHQIAGRLTPANHRSSGAAPRSRLWGMMFAAAVAGFLLSVGLSSMAPQLHPATPAPLSECAWLERGSEPSQKSAREVVVTCVSCHLSQPHDGLDSQTQLIDLRSEVEWLMAAWKASLEPTDAEIAMIVPVQSRAFRHEDTIAV